MNPSHTGEMPAPKGYVSISIDADPATHPSNAIQLTPRQFEQSTLLLDQLAERFEHYRVPASWALQNPAKNPLAERLAKSPLPHEISLLADAVLANREVTRSDLLQSIVRPLQSATESGFRLSTLAVPYAWQPRHVDLLTKYGFTMIRTPHVFSSQTTSGVARRLLWFMASASLGSSARRPVDGQPRPMAAHAVPALSIAPCNLADGAMCGLMPRRWRPAISRLAFVWSDAYCSTPINCGRQVKWRLRPCTTLPSD